VSARAAPISLALKLACAAFVAVLIPVYWRWYGFQNFFTFSDLTLFLAVAGLWREDALLLSTALVGSTVINLMWIADVGHGALGLGHSALSDYMFQDWRPLGVRLLSLFHLASPPILFFVVLRVGYDRRALAAWSLIAIVAMLVSYWCLPPPGPDWVTRKVNVNWVYGLRSDRPQDLMPPLHWLAFEFCALFLLCWWPVHVLAERLPKAKIRP